MKKERNTFNLKVPDFWQVIPFFLFIFYLFLAVAIPFILNQFPSKTINIIESGTKIAVNIAAVLAGIWALYTYRRSKRADASKWIYNLFNEFYTDEKYFWCRDKYEYEYFTVIAPLLERRVTDRYLKLSTKEIENLRNFDLLFNFFENLLYLEEEGIIVQRDREVFFEYWFAFFYYPERAGMRRYFAKCGYERLAKQSKTQTEDYIALHDGLVGFFKQNGGVPNFLEELNEKWSVCEFKDEGMIIKGEFNIYKIKDLKKIKLLDKMIGFDPLKRKESPYLRVALGFKSDKRSTIIDCWVYIKTKEWPYDYNP